jgi:hypothetical protein
MTTLTRTAYARLTAKHPPPTPFGDVTTVTNGQMAIKAQEFYFVQYDCKTN